MPFSLRVSLFDYRFPRLPASIFHVSRHEVNPLVASVVLVALAALPACHLGVAIS